MDEVKRKIYLDLFAAPTTILPIVGGLTALMGSWAFGGNAPLTFAGVAGVLGGLGIFASRIIFGLEKLVQGAAAHVQEQERKKQIASLRNLDARLQADNDARTERLLRQLWHLYETIQSDVRDGKISLAAQDILSSVSQMFTLCITHLERSLELWESATRLRGSGRRKILNQREALIAEVEESVEFLENKLEQLHVASAARGQSELSQLREELDETIRVAKRAEERAKTFGDDTPDYDSAEFE